MSDDGVKCIIPWISMHAVPSGKVYPCCMSNGSSALGEWPNKSLAEIWNGDQMKALRLRMLNGKPSNQCRRCYTLESNGLDSLRTNSTTRYSHHLDKMNETNPDGSTDNLSLIYLDVRFSNICNLKCRSCGPEYSSSWHDDIKLMNPDYSAPKVVNINKTGDFWKELTQYLDIVEEVMFAGGESIITEEHYKLLDYFIEHGKTDVVLLYTTNFTVMNYKKRDLFALWSKFKTVHVAASLDGSYKRGEYLRKGMDWDVVVSNREKMIADVPFASFQVAPTVSLLNIIHLPDFHKEWIELGLVNIDNFRLTLLTHPPYMSAKALPRHLKNVAREKIIKHIEWLRTIDDHLGLSIIQWQSLIVFMDSSDDSHLLKEFNRYNDWIDKIRSESFYDVFPELEELYD